MAEFNKIRFLIFISLMVCSSHALALYLANTDGAYNYYTSIQLDRQGGYVRRSIPKDPFTAQTGTVKVVLYVCHYETFDKIMRVINDDDRKALAEELGQKRYELLFLGVKDMRRINPQFTVGEFIREMIHTGSHNTLQIETIGECQFHMEFKSTSQSYKIYKEDPQGTLRAHFLSMVLQL